MALRIDAWTDFVCPFCFLVTCTLENLQKEEELVIHWRAFLLRPPGSPPQSAQTRAMVEQEHAYVKERARTEYGIDLHPGPVGILSCASGNQICRDAGQRECLS